MRFIKNNIWTFCWVAVLAVLTFAGDAAAEQSIMQLSQDKASNVFQAIKTIIFIVGGFGLVGIAFSAIFGKVNWKWFAGLAVGLAILAAAGSIVEYATGESDLKSSFSDSFADGVSSVQ